MPPAKPKNNEIADAFVRSDDHIFDLIYCEGWKNFYLYDHGYYKELSEDDFDRMIRQFIAINYPSVNITMALIGDIWAQIKICCVRRVKDIASNYIALKDKLVNLETFTIEDFDREKIAIFQVDIFSQSLEDPCPRFKVFLNEVFVKPLTFEPDIETINMVQEMMGFYLINNMKPHAVFFLVGGGGNGKSVLIDIIQRMIGDKFTSAMSIQTLTTNQFACSSLVGKKINIGNEEESKFIRSDRFKALVSGDMISAERKFEGQFAFRPTTKYLFASNEMPTFEGLNGGLKRRMNIIPFYRTFGVGERDFDLTAKLTKEMGGIIQFALIGAKRLVDRGYEFCFSQESLTAKVEFERGISTPLRFFDENFEIDTGGKYPVMTFYEEYSNWCRQHGCKPKSSANFFKELSANKSDLKSSVMRVGGVPTRCYRIGKKSVDPDIEYIDPTDPLNQPF